MTSPSDRPRASGREAERPGWYQAILPVLDLRQGQVVRGIGGRRDAYRPVESCFARGSAPGLIAEKFVRTFGFSDVYVADLDAICDGRPDESSLQEITAAGLEVWLDAGIGTLAAWQKGYGARKDQGVARWIIGLETLESWWEWERLVAEVGPERLVFSLDLQNGQPKSARPDFRDRAAHEIARQAHALGATQILLLDLAAVGTGQGVATDGLLQELLADMPSLSFLTGGGIQAAEEVTRQQDLGAQRVLVASALHTGQIMPRCGSPK